MNSLRVLGAIIPTVLLVTYSQIVIKWRLGALGPVPDGASAALRYVVRLLADPAIASGFLAALLGALTWMVAISRIPLSVGFPLYYGLTFAGVVAAGVLLFDESFTWYRAAGIGLILCGVAVGTLK